MLTATSAALCFALIPVGLDVVATDARRHLHFWRVIVSSGAV